MRFAAYGLLSLALCAQGTASSRAEVTDFSFDCDRGAMKPEYGPAVLLPFVDDQKTLLALLDKKRQELIEHCKAAGYTRLPTVYVLTEDLSETTFKATWSEAKSQWEVSGTILDTKPLRDRFRLDYGVQEYVHTSQLTRNPFPYKDKVIMVHAHFSRMWSEHEAIFSGPGLEGKLLVTDVSSTQFTDSSKHTVIAVRINGIRAISRGIGGEERLPSGRLVGVYFCSEWNCSDFFGTGGG